MLNGAANEPEILMLIRVYGIAENCMKNHTFDRVRQDYLAGSEIKSQKVCPKNKQEWKSEYQQWCCDRDEHEGARHVKQVCCKVQKSVREFHIGHLNVLGES
jgi:hypothetical protein